EILVGNIFQRSIADIAGIVDQDIDAPEVVQGGIDDGLPALGGGHGFRTGHRLAASGLDLVHHLGGGAAIDTLATHADTGVVDHHFRTSCREQQRIGATQAATGASDHGDAVVESQLSHAFYL